jgi:hypothetical protein
VFIRAQVLPPSVMNTRYFLNSIRLRRIEFKTVLYRDLLQLIPGINCTVLGCVFGTAVRKYRS